MTADSSTESKFIVRRGSRPEPSTKTQVRAFIQSVLATSVNLSTLIGSGASWPAIPLMGTTFAKLRKELSEATGHNTISAELEARIRTLCTKHSLGNPEKFSDIEFFLSWLSHRIDGDIPGSKQDTKIFKELKNGFLRTVHEDHSDPKNYESTLDNYRMMVQGFGESRQILGRQQKSFFDIVNIFTTNYDLFIERALEESRYAYTDGFTNGVNSKFSIREFHRRPVDLEDRFKDHLEPVNPFFRLIKLHGSINWVRKEDNILRSGINESDVDDVIISPTSSKFALTQNEPYADLFREFVNILAVPNTVLFTSGFSFGDNHVASLIKNALARPDFTLYAFVENPECADHSSELYKFVKSVNSPNAFFIYPNCEEDWLASKRSGSQWSNPPLKFADFASFVGSDVITPDNAGDSTEEADDPKDPR